ncbi:MAG: ABC transporter permease [Pseudomonadota bacterium]
MIQAALLALLSHWWCHKVQLAALMIGLALATGLWTGVQAINQEARSSYDAAASVLGQDQLDRLQRADGASIALQAFVDLRRAGWLVSPVVEGEVRIGGARLRVLGIDPLTAPPAAAAVDLTGDGDLAAFIGDDRLVFVNPETAGRLPSDHLTVRRSDHLPPGVAIADISTAWSLLDMEGFSHLLLWPEQPLGVPPLEDAAPDLVRIAADGANDVGRLTDSFHLNLTAFGLLSFVVGLFIVHSAVGLAFEQRRPMFRTLRALGLPARHLVALLGGEMLILALIGGALGIVIGYFVAAILLPDVAATLRGLYGAEVSGTLRLDPGWILAGFGIALVGTAVASAQSLWRLARLPVLAPAQPRAWSIATARSLALQAGLGSALLLVAAILALFGHGLLSGFGILATLLLGAALLLPAVLMALLKLGASFARRPLAEWIWADTRQQVPGLSLALMALLLALAASIGVGTMVSSFRLTFTDWLDQRLASELYVTAGTEEEAERLRAFLEPLADAVLPIRSVEAQVAGAPAEIYGIVDHATYRDHWPLLQGQDDTWDRIAASDGALINEQLHRRAGLSIGDAVTLPNGWSETVVGVYSDYGNPTGQVIVGLDALADRYPDLARLRHAVRISPDDAPALADRIRDEFGFSVRVINQDEVKRLSLDVFERTFLVTGALTVLTLGVAAFAILTSLLTLAAMRLPQLAPVWALGLTRRRLAWIELARAVLLALLTWLVAVPLGLLLAWLLLAIVNVEAFGWRLPLFVFPLDWLALALWAILAAALAAAWPAWRLARIPPARLLQVFAHER